MPREDWPEVMPIDEATEQYLSPDPNTTSRVDFTEFFMRFRHASDAHALYKHIFITHQELARLLCDHPAMEPNLQQSFSTPANSKNKVYFTWDFVLRTFQILAAQIDPRDPFSSPALENVLSRVAQIKTLVVDQTGELNRMNASVGYRDDGGVEFTDEIKQLADDLEKIPDGCAGCGNETKPDGTTLLPCSTPPPPVPSLLPRYPTWGRVFHSRLAAASPNITITSTDFDVKNCEYPLSLSDFDAIMLSGGGAADAVYNDVPWIKKLDAYIAYVFANHPHVKIFATCFGHGMVCQSLLAKHGVRVEPNPKGLEIGVKDITFDEMFLAAFEKQERRAEVLRDGDLGRTMRLQLVHGDHVVVPQKVGLPQEWKLIGTTDECAMQGAYLPGRVLTLQGHCDFDREINSEVIKYDFGSNWEPERLKKVLNDIDADDDAVVATKMLLAFFSEKRELEKK